MNEIKTRNRQIAEYIFDKIREFGFKPYDIKYGSVYFLFDHGTDSIVYFRLKGVWRHWKFGMWINGDCVSGWYRYLSEQKYGKSDVWNFVQIFCQHDHCIDKFKPSASDLCISYDIDDWNTREMFPNFFWELESMLNMIKKHPLLCYDGFCGRCTGYKGGSFLKDYLKYESEWYFNKTKELVGKPFWLTYTKIKLFFATKSKCIKNIIIEDFEKENPGWSTDYFYQVIPVFTKNSTELEQIKWMNRWFKYGEYGKYDVYNCFVKVDKIKIEDDENTYYFG